MTSFKNKNSQKNFKLLIRNLRHAKYKELFPISENRHEISQRARRESTKTLSQNSN